MKIFKRIIPLLLAMAVFAGLSLTAFAADSSVAYEGGAENFVFLPGSGYTDSDLFDGFKNVMPGDTLTQKITVKNQSRDSDYVNLYVRAIPHDENTNPISTGVAAEGVAVVTMTEFLSQLSLTVKQGDTVISQASADQLGGLRDNVYLGYFWYGESTELTVELSVPIELGNEYANRIGEVDWVFKVEEVNGPRPTSVPAGPGTAALPKTGDETPILLYAGMFLACLCGIAVMIMLLVGKRKNKEEA